MNKIALLFICILFYGIAHSESTNTTGKASVTLYSGPNEYSKSVTTIPPHSNVEVLGTDMSTGYAYIRAGDQQKGWIKMQHLQHMPASQALKPSVPAKANKSTFSLFTSWVQTKWHAARDIGQKKKDQIEMNMSSFFATTSIFIIGVLIGVIITRHNARKTRYIWR